MRGKPLWSSRRGLTSRITPAGAGKTTFMADIAACIWDHPRRCGENFARIHSQNKVCGITPAGAGKTAFATDLINRIMDHPRRCGENAGDLC